MSIIVPEDLKTLIKFSNFNEVFSQESNVIMHFSGIISKNEIKDLSENVYKLLNSNHRVCRRVFKVFIEICQNVSFYSDEQFEDNKASGIGKVLIIENKDFYIIFSVNKISKEDKQKLVSREKIVTTVNRDIIKDFKKRQLQHPDSKYGGANIGLAQIALDSELPLKFEFKRTKGKGFLFMLKAQIKKKLD